MTMHTIRLRTQTGHRLYIAKLEMYAPGKETELEVTAAQLKHLQSDGRIMIDSQIDDYHQAVKEMQASDKKRVRGNTGGRAIVKPMPTGPKADAGPVNAPGGKLLPKVEKPADAKSHEELVAKETAERAAVAERAKISDGTETAAETEPLRVRGRGKGKK